MKHTQFPLLALASVAMALASCSSLAPTASVKDDVYYTPSDPQEYASLYDTPAAPAEPATPTDDYYDPNTSQQLGADRGYYDMAYNDPYYYNYGRFGFGTGLAGWQSGWSGAGWGMGMGWGSNMWGNGAVWGNNAWGYGMNSPYGGYGYGGFGGYGYGGYNSWNSPYGMNGYCSYNPYGYGNIGYGYGGYYSPYGNCYNCYSPVYTGDTWNGGTIVGHRPSVGSINGNRPAGSIQRMPPRNTVGLAPMPNSGLNDRRATVTGRSSVQTRSSNTERTRTQPNRSYERNRPATTPSRSAPQRTFDSGGSSPSRSGGGGNSGGGGGGTRSSPSRR